MFQKSPRAKYQALTHAEEGLREYTLAYPLSFALDLSKATGTHHALSS